MHLWNGKFLKTNLWLNMLSASQKNKTKTCFDRGFFGGILVQEMASILMLENNYPQLQAIWNSPEG
jgi:hypothetical protein